MARTGWKIPGKRLNRSWLGQPDDLLSVLTVFEGRWGTVDQSHRYPVYVAEDACPAVVRFSIQSSFVDLSDRKDSAEYAEVMKKYKPISKDS